MACVCELEQGPGQALRFQVARWHLSKPQTLHSCLPLKVVVRRPDTGEWAEQAEADAAQPDGDTPNGDAARGAGGEELEGASEDGGGSDQGAANAALRDVFGDDDDDI